MKFIVGLGNPGAQYANTPHSVGFEAVEALAREAGVGWEERARFKCLVAKVAIGGVPVTLVKPQTFMNLSGESVAPLVKYQNSTVADLVVIQDDIDLALGRLKLRRGGSCGGHNGIRNLIERLGSPDFARVKIGVGRDEDVVAHVLGKFSPTARAVMDRTVAAAARAAAMVLTGGIDAAMNSFNGFDGNECA